MLEQRQKQKQFQKLSPKQIQLMKLIQLPNIELESRVKKEIEENPTLEEVPKEHEESETNEQDEIEKILEKQNEYPQPKSKRTNIDDVLRYADYNDEKTLFEIMMDQTKFLNLSHNEKIIAEYIIGNLNESGFFEENEEGALDNLLFSFNLETDRDTFLKTLKKIQTLDPPGIASTTLQECLLNQLRRKSKNIYVLTAIEIIENHYEVFTKMHYDVMKRKIGITQEVLEKTIHLIHKLNPKPGKELENRRKKNQYVTIDFILKRESDNFEVQMPKEKIPSLIVNSYYRSMLENYSKNEKKDKQQAEAISFIKDKINSAMWFIDAIKQRQKTLKKTMQGILEYQIEYFLSGGNPKKLRPMILKDISEKVNLDQSTISRVVNSKYVQTEFGVYALKHFFSESLTTDSGEEISTRSVKKIIKEFIDAENPKKPLSDQSLSETLRKQGYRVARRTVAKYREQMKIPISRLRKGVEGG